MSAPLPEPMPDAASPSNDPGHPSDSLHPGRRPFPILSACDHYAGTEARMRKALRLQVESSTHFDVTLDLEDGAPTGGEREHAALVIDLLRGEDNAHRGAGVRIHGPDSPHWRADVDEVIAGAGEIITHLTIPKVEGPRPLSEVIHAVQSACAAAGITHEIPLHVLVETHAAIQEVWAIAALPWLRTLEFGIMDFVSGHHGAIGSEAMESPAQFEHKLIQRAKIRQVAAALGNGLVPVHNVTLDVKNPEQTRADALRARHEFGYLRMWSIHPSQIEPILEAFAPASSEVHRAGVVLLGGRDARWGPISIDGRLYDRASYRYYWQVLQRARVAGVELAVEVDAAFFARG
jgi:citrate lyase subunit beta/citryl-CoA lyase